MLLPLVCSYYGVCERCKSTIALTSLLSKVGSGDDSVSEQIPNIEFIDILLRFHSDVWNVADMADIWSVKIFGGFEYLQNMHTRTPQVLSKVCYQKTKTNCICFQQWRVCSAPVRSLLSWLRGPHQFSFPASKFRVLLAIWFVFLIAETQ